MDIIVTNEEESKFYFSETYLGRSITSYNSDFVKHTRRFLVDFYKNSISLNNILELAGAEIINETDLELIDFKMVPDLDLSPEAITKETVISLLTNSD